MTLLFFLLRTSPTILTLASLGLAAPSTPRFETVAQRSEAE